MFKNDKNENKNICTYNTYNNHMKLKQTIPVMVFVCVM